MKDGFTRIAVILDRSGSMRAIRSATVSGFNEFVGSLRSQPGDLKLRLVRFGTEYEVVFDKPLAEIPVLTDADLEPRGMTALLDAQGKTIQDLGRELEGLSEGDRPAKVIVMTMTDGEENSSKEFTAEKVAEMVKHQREAYQWEFMYLGTNQDAIKVAASMNIPAASSMTYMNCDGGSLQAMASSAAYVGRSRSAAQGQSVAFSEAERKKALQGIMPTRK